MAVLAALLGPTMAPLRAEEPTPDIRAGRGLFHESAWSGTGLTCNHCHADYNEKRNPENRAKRLGHSLHNAANRSEWHAWDGAILRSLEEAIATCMVRWIVPRTVDQPPGLPARHHVRKLAAYLRWEEVSPERKTKPIEPMWTEKLPSDRILKMGDSGIGRNVYRRSCVNCHVENGTGPAPSLARCGYSRFQIARKVRGLSKEGIDGLLMPAFPKDRLSDRELINVVAYVYQL